MVVVILGGVEVIIESKVHIKPKHPKANFA